MIYTAVFNKISTEFWQDGIDVKAAFDNGVGFKSIDDLLKSLIRDVKYWFDCNRSNIIYIGVFDEETGKYLSTLRYKLSIRLDFIKLEEKEPPIDPQLEQLFMRNFEEIDYYE